MPVNQEQINKFKKHIRKDITITIGEDIFNFPSLHYEDLPDFWEFANLWMEHTKEDTMTKEQYDAMSKEEQDKHNIDAAGKIFNILSKTTVILVSKLCLRTMQIGYPEMELDILKGFVKDNFIPMMVKLIEANMPTD